MDLRETFHRINLHRKSYFDDLLVRTDLSMLQLELLVSLGEYPETDTFTELLHTKDYAKSHLSTAINGLVAQGYLCKNPNPTNKKVFHLALTAQGQPIVAAYHQCVQAFRQQAFAGVSAAECAIFEQVLQKIERNFHTP